MVPDERQALQSFQSSRIPGVPTRPVLRQPHGAVEPALSPAGLASPLRLLLVAPPWFPVPPPRYGGTEQVVGVLAAGLVARGHDVTVVTTGDADVAGTKWAHFHEAPTEHIGDASFEAAHLLAAYRRRQHFDLIHDHTLLGAAMATLATPTTPVVHTLHGRWTPGSELVCRVLQDTCNLVAISHDQAARAPADIHIASVVHNGIDPTAFPMSTQPGGHLAFIGRASPEKAPHLAVQVARRLGRHLVMGVKINEPAEHAYWRDVVEPLLGDDMDVTVIRNADHDQKVAILGGASAVLFPIQWPEPFGLVPIEANACGTPVVAVANGASPEVVADGRSGILVDPADGVDGLVAAVARAEALSRSGCRQHVETHFCAARMVEAYERLYIELIARAAAVSVPPSRPLPATSSAIRPAAGTAANAEQTLSSPRRAG